MIKIAFLFGSGAEGNNNYQIKTGYEFLKATLYAKPVQKGYLDALATYFGKQKFFDHNYSYSKNNINVTNVLLRRFIISKIIDQKNNDFAEKHHEEIEAVLTEDDYNELSENGVTNNFKKEKNEEKKEALLKEFKEIITDSTKKYDSISTPLFKDLFVKKNDGGINFDINVGMANILDSYFHTIINPCKYGKIKFSKIVNYYWACFFTILEDLLRYYSDRWGISSFEEYYSADKMHYEKILLNLRDLMRQLYNEVSIIQDGSYYSIISKNLDREKKHFECVGILTTNYFRFCESVADVKVAYLNGKMCWFEYPESLQVSNIIDESDNNRFYFPFVFGQSLIKPIVHSKQVEEFAKMKDILDIADVLVVLGYGINEDDNHVNSFLREFVEKKKKMVVLGTESEKSVKDKLRYQGNNIQYITIDYRNESNVHVIEKLFSQLRMLTNYEEVQEKEC